MPMFDYQDTLSRLNDSLPLQEKIDYVHHVLRERFPFVARVAVAVYDDKTDLLKTFMHSSSGDNPLSNYEARLSEVPLLREIIEQVRPRVINDLGRIKGSEKTHTQRITRQGYAASYTMPMYVDGDFFGFLFFNSYEADVFDPGALHYFDLFGHLLSLIVINELTNIRTLAAAVKTARSMTHQRDQETGAHLDRMAHYSRLIASELAVSHGLSDEFVERVFLFSPLHDIGKIGIPDHILLKPGRLDEAEFEIMKSHADKGREIIDAMLAEFSLDSLDQVEILRNIAAHHHEALNGSGYPDGLQGGEIPVESRIVAVADVFDALTSRRPYKEAWDNDRAFEALRQLSGPKLDPACVEALLKDREAVEDIQSRFAEGRYD